MLHLHAVGVEKGREGRSSDGGWREGAGGWQTNLALPFN